jgi:hypothetical protein
LKEFEKNIQVKNGQKPPVSKRMKPNLRKNWVEGLAVLSCQLSREIQSFTLAAEEEEEED